MPDPSRRESVGPLLCLGLAIAGASLAADRPRPIVAGFERVGHGVKGEAVANGLLLVGELSCTSCHASGPALATEVDRKAGPILDEVGMRARPAWLRAYLADPHAIKPGTTMPDPFAGWPAGEEAEAVEALTHFLASTGTPPHARTSRRAAGEGRSLYARLGCVACHGALGGDGKGVATGKGVADPAAPTPIPLGDLAAKTTAPALAAFLVDPLHARPSGRMPGLNLTPREANQVAQYLMQGAPSDSKPTLAYRVYEGEWTKCPDAETLTPTRAGMLDDFDLAVATRRERFAIRFEGKVRIDRAGRYTFRLRSDDGSRLAIDGKQVVDNDGVHSAQPRRGTVELAAGAHRLVVDYFDGGADTELGLEFEGPGVARQEVAGYLLPLDEGRSADDPDHFAIDRAKVEKGRGLFASVGCASCHQMKVGEAAIVATTTGARPLADLAGARGGCLAEAPPRGSPGYALSGPQRESIVAAIAAAPSSLGKRSTIERSLVALNCIACHARGDLGGVLASLDGSFQTTQKEMGDEGRLPPRLDGVGGKLNRAYLDGVLARGAKDRPYMLTRMPGFGAANTADLATALERADALPKVEPVAFEETSKRVKSSGRQLVGADALSCIKCHTFKGSEAEGIQAIDMTLMTRRLRRDWFHPYVVDPPRFRPGTRMPTSWPGGKSLLPTILDGSTAKQVESVWEFLSDGRDAATPAGLGRSPLPIYALGGEAAIYRNFIEGAGVRAIGVGYPERANLAFDANGPRLALAWQGGFMDASRHWTGRGEGFQPPMGDNVVALPAGPSFAPLPSPTAPWPAGDPGSSHGFRGYKLDARRRPTFLYNVGPARVEDRPEAFAGPKGAALSRTIALASDQTPPNLFFRAAVGRSITPLPDGWFSVDGDWKVRLDPASGPVVRESSGKQELIAPVRFADGKATVVEQIAW